MKIEIDLDSLLSTKQCPIKLCSSRNLTLSENNRSDASFRYFVICEKCREWVGKIDHHGQLSFFNFTKGRDETTYDNNVNHSFQIKSTSHSELLEALKDTHNLYLETAEGKHFSHHITRLMGNEKIFSEFKENE